MQLFLHKSKFYSNSKTFIFNKQWHISQRDKTFKTQCYQLEHSFVTRVSSKPIHQHPMLSCYRQPKLPVAVLYKSQN